ncbi:MAG: glycosyltransferase [Candidatus Heimdallarchaeota archaeon]
MKILIVSPRFPSPAYPMAGRIYSDQAILFSKSGYEVRIIVPIPWILPIRGLKERWDMLLKVPLKEKYQDILTIHPRFLSIPRFQEMGGVFYRIQRSIYRNALRKEVMSFALGEEDVIHAHSCLLAGQALLDLKRNVSLIVSIHDSELMVVASQNKYLRTVIIDTIRKANHVIYASKKLTEIGLNLAGRHSYSIIPWGVHNYAFKKESPSDFTVICVARFIKTKGIDILIESFAKLIKVDPRSRLVLVGDGPEFETIRRLISKYRIQSRVELTGYLPNREAVKRISKSDVFALPSFVEAMGTVYFEAMSVGVPIIGVNGEGISQYIEHRANGILVSPHDAEDLFSELKFLWENPRIAKEIGEQGYKTFIKNRIDWQGNAQKHAAIYKRISTGK